MKKAGIFIDKWKLSIFKRIFDDAGYNYIIKKGKQKDVLVMFVEYEMIADIKPFVDAAEEECRLKKAE